MGLSTIAYGIYVLDIDDLSRVRRYRQFFQNTDMAVRTKRGWHLYFLNVTSRGGSIGRNDRGHDVKAATGGDFVIVPGSCRDGVTYRLDGTVADDPARDFAVRYARLRPISLLGMTALEKQPGVRSKPTADAAITELNGSQQRNAELFKFGCDVAPSLMSRYGVADGGFSALEDVLERHNDQFCSPPLMGKQVSQIARNIWSRTLSGQNRRPRPAAGPFCRLLEAVNSCADAALLLLYLVETRSDELNNLALSPASMSREGWIPNWSRDRFQGALTQLSKVGFLKCVAPGSRGRGCSARYAVTRPGVGIPIARLLMLLDGDADTGALLLFLLERYGGSERFDTSLRTLTRQDGPFGSWGARRMDKARRALQAANMLVRRNKRRFTQSGGLLASFNIQAPLWLKMPESAPGKNSPLVSVVLAQTSRQMGVWELDAEAAHQPSPSASDRVKPKWQPSNTATDTAMSVSPFLGSYVSVACRRENEDPDHSQEGATVFQLILPPVGDVNFQWIRVGATTATNHASGP